LALSLCACGAASPSPSGPEEPVRIGALRGATAIGLVKLMEDAKTPGSSPDLLFDVVTTDELVPLLARGELDMAAVPAHLAATLYNNTGGAFRVVAVNTLGLFYIVETGDTIHSIEDLRGKTVMSTGKGTTPEFTLRHILRQNGIDPDTGLTLEFKNEPAEIVAILRQNGGIAMLQQPFVTTAEDNVPELREALDLTKEWDKLDSSGTLVIGVFIARTAFLEQTAAVPAILDGYRRSVDWVNQNPAEAAPLVEELGIAAADVAARAIPKCHTVFVEGAEMREMLEGYFAALFENAPESVGGALPGPDFYYVP
jgi:NitT/TauT family transport system substrate-binding protein